MVVFAELLFALAWTFGANGFLVERQLGASELPAAWVAPVAEKAWVEFHDRREWPMAFYVPPHGSDGDDAPDVPRIVLYAPYYLTPGGLPAASRMPVDVAEYYFHALLEASLDLGAGGPALDAWTSARADELMSEVPLTQRRSAYHQALGDFGAHLLSIINEISRAARRQAADGRDVCAALGNPASLFGHWQRSFGGGGYRGGYDLPGGWIQSRRALSLADKHRFLEEVLGVAWSGNPAQDFGALCRAWRARREP